MNRSKLLGWVLLILVFLVWQFFALKDAEKKEAERRKYQADSIALASKNQPEEIKKEIKGKIVETIEEPGKIGPPGNSASLENTEKEALDSLGEVEPDRLITIETNKLLLTFNTKGALIESIKIKGLDDKIGEGMAEILSENGGALGLKIGKWDLSEASWRTKETESNIQVETEPYTLEFINVLNGVEIVRAYTFFADSQKFHHELITPPLDESFTLFWKSGMRETETIPEGSGLGLDYGFFTEVVLDNGVVSRENFEGTKTFNEDSGVLRWVGLRRKYVSAMVDFNRDTDYKVVASAINLKEESEKFHTYELAIEGAQLDKKSLSFDFVVLPLWYNQALGYGKSYEKIIFTGYSWFLGADVWYVKLCGLILNSLIFFHNIVPNYGVAIILLTLVVRLLLLPLTISQTRSMAKMQEHAPAIKAIREKHKGNPQKLNQETMAYYKQVGVNPLAQMTGCFPMLLQFPVFIALFNVLGRALELKNEPFFSWISDLSRPDVLVPNIQIPYLFPMGLTVLPFFMALTMYYQTKMTITDPNQKAMVYMMPVMMFLFSASFPSGLVVYWTVSNVFTIGQTLFMKRKQAAKAELAKENPVTVSSKKKYKKAKV